MLVVNRGRVKGTTACWKVSISRVPKDNIQLFTVEDFVLALLILDPAVPLHYSRTSGGKPEFRPESARGGITPSCYVTLLSPTEEGFSI